MKDKVIYLRCSQGIKDRITALRDAMEVDRAGTHGRYRQPISLAEFTLDLVLGGLNHHEERVQGYQRMQAAIAAKAKRRPVVRGPQKKLPLTKKRGAK